MKGTPADQPVKRQCKGTASTTGQRCRKAPMKGQMVCRKHGGAAPQSRAAAERRLAEEKVARAVAKLNLRREIDPHVAMLEEVYRAAGVVAYLDEQVRALDEQDMVWGKTEQVEKTAGEFPGTDTTHAAELNVWIRWWQQERDALRKVAKDAMAAGVEERRVRLAEQQGALLADVIRRVLGDPDLGLSAEQQQKAAPVVARHLRAVAEPYYGLACDNRP